MTVYIVKIKIHENITEEFSYVEPKSYDMPGKKCSISGKLTICPEQFLHSRKNYDMCYIAIYGYTRNI
jgi:hypothetical protein